jgi:hypothetical protein
MEHHHYSKDVKGGKPDPLMVNCATIPSSMAFSSSTSITREENTPMIETVSYPLHLADWNSDSSNFYLELYGETRPLVDMSFAEIVPVGINPDDLKQTTPIQTTAVAPIYQYWWNIGQSGNKNALALREHLKNPAARVYMYFPLTAGWRIKEIAATVKYLTPVKDNAAWLNSVFRAWDVGAPVIGGAADIAKFIPGMSTASPYFSALSRIKLNEVPPIDDFAWYVGKVTTKWNSDTLQGIMWTLPRKMFTHLGGRITGSLAVSFIPFQVQQAGAIRAATDEPIFLPQPIRAHARIYLNNHGILSPDQGVPQRPAGDTPSDDIFPPDESVNPPDNHTICLPADSKQQFIELHIQPQKP